jgi:hypothetical protein
MTPQEQELVNELLDRLAKLEGSPRDPVCRAPNRGWAEPGAARSLRAGADGAGSG